MISSSSTGETTNCAPAAMASRQVWASRTVPTPTIARSPRESARASMPASALGVDMVTSMAGTPPSRRAAAMPGSWSLESARMTATTPALSISAKSWSLERGMLKEYSSRKSVDSRWQAERGLLERVTLRAVFAGPADGFLEGLGQGVDVAFALEADHEDAGLFLEEQGADGDDRHVAAAAAEGVDDVVGLVVDDAELADDVVLAAAAAPEAEGRGE